MRVWIDMTAPAHPVVLRPVIRGLEARGHEVTVTAREYAQTLSLLDLQGIPYVPFGRHGGAGRARKLAALITRGWSMHRFGKAQPFDLAIAHGSNDLALAASWLGIPAVNMFDYEFAVQQHHIGCRLARRVLIPDAIPPERVARYGARGPKLVQYQGLKEEYYLADFEPDSEALVRLGVDQESMVVVVVRPPPDVSLYHRKSNPLFPQVLTRIGQEEGVRAVVLPRTERQRDYVRALALPSLIVPEGAVEAQSLVALADLVVSAGGTMNREAAALGTPVYTTYGGRLGGVDEELIRQGRLRPLTSPRALKLEKRERALALHRRDPRVLVEHILGVLDENPAEAGRAPAPTVTDHY